MDEPLRWSQIEDKTLSPLAGGVLGALVGGVGGYAFSSALSAAAITPWTMLLGAGLGLGGGVWVGGLVAGARGNGFKTMIFALGMAIVGVAAVPLITVLTAVVPPLGVALGVATFGGAVFATARYYRWTEPR